MPHQWFHCPCSYPVPYRPRSCRYGSGTPSGQLAFGLGATLLPFYCHPVSGLLCTDYGGHHSLSSCHLFHNRIRYAFRAHLYSLTGTAFQLCIACCRLAEIGRKHIHPRGASSAYGWRLAIRCICSPCPTPSCSESL